MPVEFLTDEQVRGYGRYAGMPSQAQLDRFFFLDERDQALIGERRSDHNRLGFAVQLATVRFLGTFLADPLEVPWPVVEHLAAQLGIADPSCVKQYAARLPTQHEHAREIRQVYSYQDFGDPQVQAELRTWLAARAWTSAERPSVLFDRATAWLLERKVLLPGATVLARLVARERDQAATRLWQVLSGLAAREPGLPGRLERLLVLEPPGRVSRLERLRRAPTRVSAKGLVDALDRVAELRGLGADAVDVAGVPPGRLHALARYAMGATPHTLSRLAPDRHAATLLAVARHLETTAVDDALNLLDVDNAAFPAGRGELSCEAAWWIARRVAGGTAGAGTRLPAGSCQTGQARRGAIQQAGPTRSTGSTVVRHARAGAPPPVPLDD